METRKLNSLASTAERMNWIEVQDQTYNLSTKNVENLPKIVRFILLDLI